MIRAGDYGSFQKARPSRPVWHIVPGLPGTPGVIRFAVDATTASEGTSASLRVTRSGGTILARRQQATVTIEVAALTVTFRDSVARNLANRRFMRIKIVRTP